MWFLTSSLLKMENKFWQGGPKLRDHLENRGLDKT
jgi:hypothetical protein